MMKRFVLFQIFATASLGFSAQDVAGSCAIADTVFVAAIEADIRSGKPDRLELVSKEKRYWRQCKHSQYLSPCDPGELNYQKTSDVWKIGQNNKWNESISFKFI